MHTRLFPVREMPRSISTSLARACSTVPGSLSCRRPLLIKFNWLTLLVTVAELLLLSVLELLALSLSDWSSSCTWRKPDVHQVWWIVRYHHQWHDPNLFH